MAMPGRPCRSSPPRAERHDGRQRLADDVGPFFQSCDGEPREVLAARAASASAIEHLPSLAGFLLPRNHPPNISSAAGGIDCSAGTSLFFLPKPGCSDDRRKIRMLGVKAEPRFCRRSICDENAGITGSTGPSSEGHA
jgi:hypothetical protein